jgi:hypothetical protein
MISWLESNAYAVDYCTDLDVHQDRTGTLLDPLKYRLLISVGHDEYWSQEMRDNVSSFVNRGGNVAFFSGNLLPWRIHFCDDDTAFYCDKGVMDPLQGFINGPDLWWRLANPENTLTGVSLRNAGYVTQLHDAAGFRVQNSDHWVYAGTGLSNDDVFGATERLLSYEVDGARYTRQSPDSPAILDINSAGGTLDGTPNQFLILGTFDVKGPGPGPPVGNWYLVPRETPDGHLTESCPDAGCYGATMGLYATQGTVFAAGTTDWARVLVANGNQAVDRITRNVVDGLTSPSAVVGIGDLNGDGQPDLLLQHPITHQLTYKIMNGLRAVGGGALDTIGVSPDWRVVARTNPANVGDDEVDLLWRSVVTKQLSYWNLDGVARVKADYIAVPGIAPSADWNIVGVGRLHGDSRTDIVWQSELTGQLSYWFMDGVDGMTRSSFGPITPDPGAAFTVVAVADLDGDGFADLLLRNMTTNQLVIWYLNGTTMASSAVVTDSVKPKFVAGAAWKVVGVGDFNGDGQPDIVFQNVDPRDTDYSRLVVWFMAGPVRVGAAHLETAT